MASKASAQRSKEQQGGEIPVPLPVNESAGGGDPNHSPTLSFNRSNWIDMVNALSIAGTHCARFGEYAQMTRFNALASTIAERCLGGTAASSIGMEGWQQPNGIGDLPPPLQAMAAGATG